MQLNRFLFPLCLLFFVHVSGQVVKDSSIPKLIGTVNDFEKIYSPQEIKTLDSIIVDFKKRKTIQISIVTIDTTLTKKENFDSWTLKVMNSWGVGEKNKNNGILIAISRGYRRIRIQNGYGIEKILSNGETKEIIDNDMIPSFKEAKYFEGTLNGLQALIKKLE
ncbi:MAG TPA: TPM domain-containing protein [Chitinophagaceae bacterium]|nr:TPM domain-containing protein [Chitinophagaceae bacterium]